MSQNVALCFLILIQTEVLDEYDKEFLRMRDESQKSYQAKMTDDFEKAKHNVEECKRVLLEKKKQVKKFYCFVFYFSKSTKFFTVKGRFLEK